MSKYIAVSGIFGVLTWGENIEQVMARLIDLTEEDEKYHEVVDLVYVNAHALPKEHATYILPCADDLYNHLDNGGLITLLGYQEVNGVVHFS